MLKGAVSRIYTRKGGTAIQDLRYTYDERLNVKSRTDALQSSFKEMFWYDALDRLTCSQLQPPGTKCHSYKDCPCSLEVAYQENGNIHHKSDVGDYSYDPAQPHAAIKAGSGDYLYDPVGNQKRRPDAAITYTAFDLPSVLSPFAGQEVTYAYDADQARVKKSTLDEETVSFEGLYERITNFTIGSAQHRYYVPAGLATVVVTREGNKTGTTYVHPDALGSTDVLTDSAGLVVERQSYDAFGKRRSPSWGQPAPGAFPASGTSLGYTGHEPDALGLINMGGRILDPKLGRFLMTDPINSNPLNGQRWNAYSFVLNNPMSYVDPSGFDPQEPNTWGYINFTTSGWAFHDEIGARLAASPSLRPFGVTAIDPQEAFDDAVFSEELDRDDTWDPREHRLVETWHPGNLAYAAARSDVVVRRYSDRVVASIARQSAVVIEVVASEEVLAQRQSEAGPLAFFLRTAQASQRWAAHLGLPIITRAFTDGRSANDLADDVARAVRAAIARGGAR